jgi:hypothetical protein
MLNLYAGVDAHIYLDLDHVLAPDIRVVSSMLSAEPSAHGSASSLPPFLPFLAPRRGPLNREIDDGDLFRCSSLLLFFLFIFISYIVTIAL